MENPVCHQNEVPARAYTYGPQPAHGSVDLYFNSSTGTTTRSHTIPDHATYQGKVASFEKSPQRDITGIGADKLELTLAIYKS